MNRRRVQILALGLVAPILMTLCYFHSLNRGGREDQTNVAEDESESGSPKRSCCLESQQMTLENIRESTSQCSEAVNFSSFQCDCEMLIACKLKVVSAVSDNHFEEITDMIASVQTHMPDTPILVYNLGLTEGNARNLSSYCNVQVRHFNFSSYPVHVQSLYRCAWKPLIINELYEQRTSEVILWCDASCRLLRSVKPLLQQFFWFPIIPGSSDSHPFISTTHDGMMKYLHLNKTRLEYVSIGDSLQAGLNLYWFTKTLQEKFLRFWVDCALHKECIEPRGARLNPCNWKSMKSGAYACHRYDQAAFNAILTREFGLEFMKELAKSSASEKYIKIARYPTNRFSLHIKGNCQDN